MRIKTLNISAIQRGRQFFETPSPVLATGDTLVCHNLRADAEADTLRLAPPPATVASLGGAPIIADPRHSGYYFLRQEDDGSIIVDGFLSGGLRLYEKIDANLGSPGKRVVRACSGGQFVVLHFDDRSLGYILYDDDTRAYTLLGAMPVLPMPSAVPVARRQISETVDAVTFRTPQDDIRAGIDTDALDSIGKALRAAWQRLRRRAVENEVWLQPVEVRFAYRTADDQLIHVSNPCWVAFPWSCGDRVVSRPLNNSSGQTVGLAEGTLTAEGYRLELSPDAVDLGVWNRVIATVEVWVTEESDPVDPRGPVDVGVATTQAGTVVLSSLPMLPGVSLNASLAASPSGVLRRVTPGENFGELAPRADVVYNLFGEVLASMRVPRHNVACIAGHDGFLHIASSDGIVTCMRGNPFVKVSATPGNRSDTRLMVPQIWGGGAFTRQIIYVAGDRGVSALTHDFSGRHTNFRTICPKAPLGVNFTATADDAVYMLLEDGTLTRFSGTRAQKLVSRIEGCHAICHSRSYGELILMPHSSSGHCVVIGPGSLRDVSTRDRWQAQPIDGARELVYSLRSDGVAEIHDLNHPRDYAPADEKPECRWSGRFAMPASADMWSALTCGIGGDGVDGVDAEVAVGCGNPVPDTDGSPDALTRFTVKGTPHGLLRLPFRPGATRSGLLATRGHWHIHIRGRLTTLYHLTIE